MHALLSGWGMQVECAPNAAAALAQAGMTAPDVLLVDYRLGEEADGISAISALREHWQRALPAILVTGDTAPERLQQARASGLPLLHKPVRPAAIRSLLRQQLRAAAG
jgi:CheY-like chemotaxis protein